MGSGKVPLRFTKMSQIGKWPEKEINVFQKGGWGLLRCNWASRWGCSGSGKVLLRFRATYQNNPNW